MSWFYNLRTMSKLMLAFAFISAIMATVGFVSMRNMSRINDMLGSIYDNDLKGTTSIMGGYIDLLEGARAARDGMLANDAQIAQASSATLDSNYAELQ